MIKYENKYTCNIEGKNRFKEILADNNKIVAEGEKEENLENNTEKN